MSEKIVKEFKYNEGKKKLKSFSNKFLYSFLFIFIAGYIFFFSSTLWLPKTYQGVPITAVGETISKNNRNITLDEWVYSPSQQMMEIIIEVENNSIDNIREYSWQARDKNGFLKTEVVAQDEMFTVIHVKNVKKSWAEVSLRIMADEEGLDEEEVKFDTIVIYTNDKVTPIVSEIKISSLREYKLYAYESKIESYEKAIEDLRGDISQIDESVKNADERIEELEDRLEYQTEQEKEETRNLITNFEQTKEQLFRERNLKETEIVELREKIENQKRIMSEL